MNKLLNMANYSNKIQEITFLEKIISMFILMNNISNINSERYIEYKMKRYTFVGETFGLSIESIRKISRIVAMSFCEPRSCTKGLSS